MQIVKKITNSPAAKQSAFMVFGNTFASGLSAIALIIYSRTLGPEKFGAFSIGASVVLLLSKLADGGINLAIERTVARAAKNDQEGISRLITIGTKYKAIMTAILTVVFYISSDFLSQKWLKTQYTEIVRFAIIFASVNVLFDYIVLIHESLRNFTRSVGMNVVQALTKASIALAALGLKITNPFIVFTLYTLSPMMGVLFGLTSLPKWMSFAKDPDKKYTRALNSVLLFSSISVISSSLSDNIDILLVKSYLSEYETGLYSAGARISMIISIIAFSLGAVLNARVAQYTNSHHFGRYFNKALIISAGFLLSAIAIVPLSGPLLYLTAGSDYLEATQTVAYLFAAGMITAATTPFVAMFYSFSKPQFFALRGVFQGVILIAANVILIPTYGIEGAGASRLITRIAVLLFTVIYALYLAKKEYQISLRAQLKKIARHW